jgi:hypothetical protein
MSDGDTSKLDPSSPKDRGGEREREREGSESSEVFESKQ